MFFKKRDLKIKEAIKFMKSQKELNEENIKRFKKYGFSTSKLEKWNDIYNDIIEILKSIK